MGKKTTTVIGLASNDEEKKEVDVPDTDAPRQLLRTLRRHSIPFVPIDAVKIGPQLGPYTKCGSGYKSKWDGKDIALKRYDRDSFHRFEREITNYYRMKDSWSVLIPTPYFVSYDESYIYFGMELARDPNDKDNVSEAMFQNTVINELKRKYGFVHCSPGWKHIKFLPGKNEEADRMIAIDLENHYWV